jgi:hypothetical protein
MKLGTINILKRRLSNMLAGLSLLLCVAIAGLWVRSFWVQDGLAWNTQQWGFRLYCSRGLLMVAIDLNRSPVPGQFQTNFPPGVNRGTQNPMDLPADVANCAVNGWSGPTPVRIYYWQGFGFYRYDFIDVVPETDILFPLWVLLGLLLVLPVFRIIRRAPWSSPGHCPRCGYDLRATPERCPECGRLTSRVKGITEEFNGGRGELKGRTKGDASR